jgi:hypothetical protein
MRASPLILLSCLLCCGCKDEGTPPPPYVPTIQLSMEDASSTEAWLKIRLTDSAEPRTVVVRRDSQSVLTAQMTTNDSVLIDENLLPRRTYTYRAFRLNGTTPTDSSTPVQVTTMDTTSHNLTWQIDTLGATASTLYDVVIINDTLAYAVGEIYLRDSTGQLDPIPYNMAKWNGVSWQIMRIQFYTICGQMSRTPYAAKSILAFDPNDVWIAMDGSQMARWNGTTQTATICNPDPFVINKIWGESPNSIWAVGLGGRIGHYVNGAWQRVESGTTVTLNDVWGGSNRWVGDNVVLVAASYKFEPGEMRIVRINASGLVDSLPWPMQDRRIHSVWFDGRSRVFTSGGGVFLYAGGSVWHEQPVPLIFTDRLRGTSANDIWVVGDFGIVAHFNGYTWRDFPEVRLSGIYESVDVKDGLMIAVGWTGNRAVVLRVRQ